MLMNTWLWMPRPLRCDLKIVRSCSENGWLNALEERWSSLWTSFGMVKCAWYNVEWKPNRQEWRCCKANLRSKSPRSYTNSWGALALFDFGRYVLLHSGIMRCPYSKNALCRGHTQQNVMRLTSEAHASLSSLSNLTLTYEYFFYADRERAV